jgi:branched-chain amino acid aminotransferase
MPKSIWFNGKLVPPDQAKVSVYDHGLLYGDGVFEGIRAYNGKVLKMRTHLLRLEESARSIMLKLDYSVEQLEQAIHATLKDNGIASGYIRLCVTRGVGPLGLNPFTCKESTTFIIADSIQLYPAELYTTGMEIVTASTVRNHPAALSPRIKSMNYLNNIMAKIEGVRAGVPEALMLNTQGFVAECTGDNIFLVKHGVLFTPPLHAGVLEGVTRNLVIELAQKAGIEVRQPDLTRHDVYIADECFLTGTAAEAIPVTKVDSRPIGTGKPGPITTKLIAAFRKLVENPPED